MDDMLGNIVRLLVTVPGHMLGVLADLLTKMMGHDREEWFDNLKLFLRKQPSWVSGVVKKSAGGAILLLTFVRNINTSASVGKKTCDCFTDKSRYLYRDLELDAWLPADQPQQSEGKFSIQQLARPANFKEAIENLLELKGGDIQYLSKMLKVRGDITTLPVIESLIDRQEAGEDVGLNVNGHANFFFVEEKSKERGESGVSVVCVNRYGNRWNVSICGLSIGYRWDVGYRFFFSD